MQDAVSRPSEAGYMKAIVALASACVIPMAIFFASIEAPGAPPPTPPPGKQIDLGGYKLHVHCIGPTNAPVTVVFESGAGGDSRDWIRVRQLLPPDVRSCAYDRAGYGWSEPGPKPRTLRQESFELHRLLEEAGIAGPYVLVGQSLGGLLARIYIEHYGTNVVGAVLVDPTHESSTLGSLRHGGWVRLREKASGRPIPEPRRAPGAPNESTDEDFLADELQQLYLARRQEPQPFGDRPLIVLGAGRRTKPPGTSDDLWKQLTQEKTEQIQDSARLSRNSRYSIDAASSHAIHMDNPGLVAEAILEVIRAATNHARLSP